MEQVISYSGIATKLRAMRRELLTEAQLQRLAAFRLSSQKAKFLSGFKPYADLFDCKREKELHRSEVERRLVLSELRDFDRLYRFGNARQKRFLKLYFGHFEADALRRLLHEALSRESGGVPEPENVAETPAGVRAETPAGTQANAFYVLLQKYSKLDLHTLLKGRRLADLIGGLRETPYYLPLRRLYERGNARAADYETAIDMRYFAEMWKWKDKLLTKEEQRIIERTFGSRIDLLNMSWIYRAKRYFSMSGDELYTLLIPVRARLSKEAIQEMVTAPDLAALRAAEQKTCYGSRLPVSGNGAEAGSLREAREALLRSLYEAEARKHPFSIAPINTYFFLKEKEIERIVSVIEESHYEELQSEGHKTEEPV